MKQLKEAECNIKKLFKQIWVFLRRGNCTGSLCYLEQYRNAGHSDIMLGIPIFQKKFVDAGINNILGYLQHILFPFILVFQACSNPISEKLFFLTISTITIHNTFLYSCPNSITGDVGLQFRYFKVGLKIHDNKLIASARTNRGRCRTTSEPQTMRCEDLL